MRDHWDGEPRAGCGAICGGDGPTTYRDGTAALTSALRTVTVLLNGFLRQNGGPYGPDGLAEGRSRIDGQRPGYATQSVGLQAGGRPAPFFAAAMLSGVARAKARNRFVSAAVARQRRQSA